MRNLLRALAPVAALTCGLLVAVPAHATESDVPVGSEVCIDVFANLNKCGTVTAVNQTVSLPQGSFNGLTATNICVPWQGTNWPVYSGLREIGRVVGVASGPCDAYYRPS